MLSHLADYATSHSLLSEPGFSEREVHWAVHVDKDGRFTGLEDWRVGRDGRSFAICPFTLSAEMARSPHDNPRCHFLVETARLLLDHLESADSSPGKVELRKNKLRNFQSMLGLCAEAVPELHWLRSTNLFLQSPHERSVALGQLVARLGRPPDNVVIVVEDKIPLQSRAWHDWWRQHRRSFASPAADSAVASPVRDLLSGELTRPALTHPKIQGMAGLGGLSTGETLISFDKTAFESYELSQASNAPLSPESAALYVAALNHLVKHGVKVAGSVIACWATPRQEGSPLQRLFEPALPSSKSEGRYHLLRLQGGSGRLRVLDWLQGEIADLELSGWYSDLQIVDRGGESLADPPSLSSVIAALEKDHEGNLPNALSGELLRSAVTGSALPASLLSRLVELAREDVTNSEESGFTIVRMALLRAFHRRRGGKPIATHLDFDCQQPAYLCGRLFALLLSLQGKSLGYSIGAGPIGRLYAYASCRPALGFPRLLALGRSFLSGLSEGPASFHRAAVADLLAKLGGKFPPILDLEAQSLFALASYQQQAETLRRQRQTAQLQEDFSP